MFRRSRISPLGYCAIQRHKSHSQASRRSLGQIAADDEIMGTEDYRRSLYLPVLTLTAEQDGRWKVVDKKSKGLCLPVKIARAVQAAAITYWSSL